MKTLHILAAALVLAGAARASDQTITVQPLSNNRFSLTTYDDSVLREWNVQDTSHAYGTSVLTTSADDIQLSSTAASHGSFSVFAQGTTTFGNGQSYTNVNLGLSYIPADGYTGDDSVVITYAFGSGAVVTSTITFHIPNIAPTVSISTSGAPFLVNQGVPFFANGADADHEVLQYAWDFGDGTPSIEQNPVHAYTAAGTYNVTVIVIDAGGLRASATTAVTIYDTIQEPLASFVMSTVNATVAQPIGFDATFTTDPANSIAGYVWDFGDGTPLGSGVVLAHLYQAAGVYDVKLTVTDGHGLTNSTTASVVVTAAATATPFVNYTARFNTAKTNADALSVAAQLNTGGTVTAATPLSVTVAGSSFTGTAGAPAQTAFANGAQVKWTVKPVRKSPGVYALKAVVHRAKLTGFPAHSGKFTTPVKLSIGTHVFATPVASTFRFGLGGGVGSGK